MTIDNRVELHSRMESVLENPGFQNELAQVRAKATLQAIGELEDSPNWTYVAKRFSRNSAAALYALEAATLADPSYAVRNKVCSRQLAHAWENLAKLEEGVSRSTALLNAALASELAGYQANAAYLAKEILPRPCLDSRADAQSLVASFMQRRLIITAHLANYLLRNPPNPDSSIESLSLELGEVVLADGLLKACRFFLSGARSAYREAVRLLEEASRVFAGLGAPLHSNIVYGVRSVLPLMMQKSTWTQLKPYADRSEIWKRYLTLLARPLSRGVTELWPSQIEVLESGFLGSNESSVIRLPTSGGKTRIAEMAIIDTLHRYPEAKCVFVAPYRALASEVERTLGTVVVDLGYRVSSVVGSYEADEFEVFLLRTADLLIVTPEKLDLIFRLRPDIADQFRLIVLDEVHIMDDANRGIKFELLLHRLKSRLPKSRFLVMSAVVPGAALKEFAMWLAGSLNRSMTSEWRPTVQRLARFEWKGTVGTIQFERDAEIPRLGAFVPGALKQRPYSWINPETGRPWTRQYPKPTKQDTAAELAYVFSDQGPALVFCTQPNWVESVCKAILNKSIGYRSMVGEPIPARFSSPTRTRSQELACEWLGQEHIATKALSQGIAPHHGKLPHIVREAIEVDCRNGHYQVIVATNTLAQGVNLPVRTVIMHSTWRSEEGGQRSRIPVRDYRNIAGRAGRAGMETEGLVIHIVLTLQDQRDFVHYKDLQNLEPVAGALWQLLQRIVSSRISNEALESAAEDLDPEILAIAVEEGIETADSDHWLASLKTTYAARQACVNSEDIGPLVRCAQLATANLLARVPEPSWRKVFAQTGLSSFSCQTLLQFVNAHSGALRTLLLGTRYDDMETLHRLVIDSSLSLPEAQTTATFAGDLEVLLGLWIAGTPINETAAYVSDHIDSEEQLSRFIEEFFGYKLPWIVSALFRISKESLGIHDEDVSEYIRCYPSMVKYGLPDPVAAWAMSAGISTRSTARRLAEAFEGQIPDSPSHEDFVAWLSNLSDDSLHHDYRISGHVLYELRYKLGRMATNPFLKPIKPLHTVLPYQTQIAGILYKNRRWAARRVRKGDRLELRRDYENPVDRNAIEIHHKSGQIGFLPRNLAQRLAPEIDAGAEIEAAAVATTQRDEPAVTIRLYLRQSDSNPEIRRGRTDTALLNHWC